MTSGFGELVGAALGGGMAVKLFEVAVNAFQGKRQRTRKAKDVVDAHLDPLVKAADEIVGKTNALARRDFKSITGIKKDDSSSILDKELIGTLYLYAQFWSQIEILRQESIGISIANDERGAILKDFLSCLESKQVRLVDRVHQKAIGEITTEIDEGGRLKSIGVVNFASTISQNNDAKEWISPLASLFANIKIKSYRQRVLVYGVVMHALIDTLDSEHHASHDRPGYANKLSKNSSRDIKYRVFKVYLKQVENIDKYLSK